MRVASATLAVALAGAAASCAVRTQTDAGVNAAAPPAAAAPEDAGGVLWTVGPGAIDLARYYPAGAREQNVSGRAELSCRISGRRPSSCVVVSEDPPGMGFGLAAIRASANLLVSPRDRSGASQEGAKVKVPFHWSAAP